MVKKRVLKIFLILIVLSLLVSATYASNPCGCTCICNNTCPADEYGQLAHRMISTGEASVYHCDTDTHWFFKGILPKKCTYQIAWYHGKYICAWCDDATCYHGGNIEHTCNHHPDCGQSVECPGLDY